jgi:hypothetical protein
MKRRDAAISGPVRRAPFRAQRRKVGQGKEKEKWPL